MPTKRRDIRRENFRGAAMNNVVAGQFHKQRLLVFSTSDPFAQCRVGFMHTFHRSMDMERGIKSRHGSILRWPESIHARMLKDGVLLEFFRVAAVIKPDKVG